MAWQPDMAVCISLAARADRRAALADADQRLGFPLRFTEAIDGTTLPAESIRTGWSSSPQAYACMLSHQKVLSGLDPGATVLVLEDDALIQPNFQPAIQQILRELPPFWESIYLGGEHARHPVPIGKNSARCTQPIRTLAYILRGNAISTALQVSKSAMMHWDRPLGHALVMLNTCYAASPFIIQPDDLPGDIPDSEPYRAVV